MCPVGLSGLNVLRWLAAYLDECGRNGAKPLTGSALERFLPWNTSPGDLHAWATPPGLPANPRPRQPTTASATRTGHAGSCHARSQDFRIRTVRVARPRLIFGLG